MAHAADVTWDGGGTDNDWNTQENWSGDTVPGSSDNAIFDDTSTKDCDVTDLQSVASLTVASGYTGAISVQSAGTLSVNGSLSVSGGTLNVSGLATVNAGAFTNEATVNVLTGGVLDANGATTFVNTGTLSESGTGKILRVGSLLAFTDAGGGSVSIMTVGADLYVTLTDSDENLNGLAPDTATVVVKSLPTGDQETVTLTEIGPDSGLFRNLTGLPTAGGAANSEDGTLQTGGANVVEAKYTDAEDATDVLGPVQLPFSVIWDGGGSDNLWETAENWAGDAVPPTGGFALFNGTSTKACTVGSAHQLAALHIESGYTGTITVQDVALTIDKDFAQAGGSLDWGAATHTFNGDFALTGGSQSASSATFVFSGDTAQTAAFGSPGITLKTYDAVDGSGSDLFLQGNLSITTAFTQGSGKPTRLQGTVTLQSGSALSVESSGVLEVLSGGVLDAQLADTFTNAGALVESGTGKILRKAEDVFFCASDGTPAFFVEQGQDVYIQVLDDDENLDGTALDTTTVQVKSVTTNDIETLTLTETGNATAAFRNLVAVPTQAAAANPGDGILQYTVGEDLLITYTDDEDASDIFSVNMSPRVLTWDGGGADNSWQTAANWSDDRVPTRFDAVVFDGTSNKFCESIQPAEALTLTVKATHAGSVQFFSSPVTIFGNVTVQGLSSVTLGSYSQDQTVKGNVLVDNASSNLTFFGDIEGNLEVDDCFIVNVQGSVSGNALITGGTQVNFTALTIQGDWIVQGGDENRIGGATTVMGDVLLSGGVTQPSVLTLYGDFINDGGGVVDMDAASITFKGSAVKDFDPGTYITSGSVPQRFRHEGSSGSIVNLYGDYDLRADDFFKVTAGTTNVYGRIRSVEAGNNHPTFYNAGILNVQDGAELDLENADFYTNLGTVNQIGSGKIHWLAGGLGFTDAAGLPVTSATPGDDLFVTLLDDDENIDYALADTTTVLVESLTTGDAVTLTLTETGTVGEFRNTAGLPTENAAVNLGDSVLQYDGTEDVRVTYVDNEDSADTLTHKLSPDPVVWDGEAGDNDWDTPANWSGDKRPTRFDSVLFDGTSSDFCEGLTPVKIIDLTVSSSHSGGVRLPSSPATIFGNVTVQGGSSVTLGSGSQDQTVKGNVLVDSASTNLTFYGTIEGNFEVDGCNLILMHGSVKGNALITGGTQVGFSGLTIDGDWTIQGGDNNVISGSSTVKGDVLISGGVTQPSVLTLYGDFINDGGGVVDMDAASITFKGSAERDFDPGAYITSGSVPQRFRHEGSSGSIVNLYGDYDLRADDFFKVTAGTTNVYGKIRSVVAGNNEPTFYNAGILNVQDGAEFDLENADFYTNLGTVNQIGSGKIHWLAGGLGFTDAAGLPVTSATPGDDLFVTLLDDDENIDYALADTTTVLVESLTTGDAVTLTLTETGTVGEFRNTAGLPTENAAVNLGDSVLQYDGTEDVRVTYVDDEDSADTLTHKLSPDPVVWDGEAGDNDWDTPANWSGDKRPTRFDSVLFDGTSSDFCEGFTPVKIIDLTVTAAHTGGVRLFSSPATIFGNLTVQGLSSVTLGSYSQDQTVKGNVLVDNASSNLTFFGDIEGNLEVDDCFIVNVQGSVSGNALITGGTQVNFTALTIQGDWIVQGGDENRIGGATTVKGDVLISGGVTEPSVLTLYGDFVNDGGGVVDMNGASITFKGSTEKDFDPGTYITSSSVPQRFRHEGSSGSIVNLYGDYDLRADDFFKVTAGTTNVFGKIRSVEDGNNHPTFYNAGILNVQNGAEFDLENVDFYTNLGTVNQIGTGKIHWKNTGIGVTNATGSGIPFSYANDLYITLLDADANEDGTALDTISVTISNLENGDVETLELTESAIQSGEFRNLVLFPTASGPATPFNNIFEGQGRERILLHYEDPQDASDVVSIADFDVSPTDVDFGAEEVAQGESDPITVTITNPNDTDLNLNEITIGDSGAFASAHSRGAPAGSRAAASFKFAGTPDLSPVPPGESRVIQLVFDPQASGLVEADLLIDTNNPIRPSFVASLSGVGAFAPSAVIGGGSVQTINVTDGLSLDGSSSSDSDGTIDSWTWDFGDGTVVTLPSPGGATPPDHFYSAPGIYTVTLVVTDNDGADSAPAMIQVIVVGGADDSVLYVQAAAFGLNRKKADADTFKLGGQLNPNGLPADLTGVQASFFVNDTQIGATAALDSKGKFKSPKGIAPALAHAIAFKNGKYKLSVKTADLQTAIDLPDANDAGSTFVGLRLLLSGGGLAADIDRSGVFAFAYSSKAGSSSKGKFSVKKDKLANGVFISLKTSATEAKDGSGATFAFKGMIAPGGGGIITPTNDIDIDIGGQVFTIPFGELIVGTDGSFAYDAKTGSVSELKSFAVKGSTKSFALTTNLLDSTDLPPAGISQPLEHPLDVEITVPTADGDLIFQTTIQLMRKSDTTTKWAR